MPWHWITFAQWVAFALSSLKAPLQPIPATFLAAPMRRFFLLLLLCATVSGARAQKQTDKPVLPRDPETGKVTYTAVVEVPGATQAQLKQRAVEWISKNIGSRDGAAPVQDPETGRLTVQVEQHTMAQVGIYPLPETVYSTLVLYTKDGKYKYEFTHFNAVSMGPFENDEPAVKVALGGGMVRRAWNATRHLTDTEVKGWIASLDQAMHATTKAGNDF
jgi:hypothetical protein